MIKPVIDAFNFSDAEIKISDLVLLSTRILTIGYWNSIDKYVSDLNKYLDRVKKIYQMLLDLKVVLDKPSQQLLFNDIEIIKHHVSIAKSLNYSHAYVSEGESIYNRFDEACQWIIKLEDIEDLAVSELNHSVALLTEFAHLLPESKNMMAKVESHIKIMSAEFELYIPTLITATQKEVFSLDVDSGEIVFPSAALSDESNLDRVLGGIDLKKLKSKECKACYAMVTSFKNALISAKRGNFEEVGKLLQVFC